MPTPIRITVALDAETKEILDRLKAEMNLSQSEILRRALKKLAEEKVKTVEQDKLSTYIDMLAHGEHIILDVDHWQLFLKMVEEGNEEFWEAHRRVASSHAEQLRGKVKTPEDVIKRLETCNFFKLSGESGEYTLIFGSETAKKFVKIFLEEVFRGMNFRAEIKEDFTKLRIRVLE